MHLFPTQQLPEAMTPSINAVKEVGADLGIVLDTDVDRSGVVDRSGEAINRNRLIAFMTTIVLRDNPGTTIVTDSTTSNGLKVVFFLSFELACLTKDRADCPSCLQIFLGFGACGKAVVPVISAFGSVLLTMHGRMKG